MSYCQFVQLLQTGLNFTSESQKFPNQSSWKNSSNFFHKKVPGKVCMNTNLYLLKTQYFKLHHLQNNLLFCIHILALTFIQALKTLLEPYFRKFLQVSHHIRIMSSESTKYCPFNLIFSHRNRI